MILKKGKPLLAYEAHDGDEGWCVVFATSNAPARRMAANEMDCDWSGVEFCRRAKSLDQYAPGPVPTKALIGNGWQFECCGCLRRVNGETAQPVYDGQSVFCCPWCRLDYIVERGVEKTRCAEVDRECRTLFPGGSDFHARVSQEFRGGRIHSVAAVTFRFPGGENRARWEAGDETVTLWGEDDRAAWNAWREAGYPSAREATHG
ncbi:hypothetical protein D3877_16255 [Azospirillum cavernae]|uniref:Uncharacterized protein n=1 Tax=Azospirillum cavernae TaxID=2320860 RepID=A0A418VX36_9PROT|nr:hypothetical protein [Azospirillum cavernae]RJF81674.1 hypothetical protein D3877_16255 [Azospirillum cavernae]